MTIYEVWQSGYVIILYKYTQMNIFILASVYITNYLNIIQCNKMI